MNKLHTEWELPLDPYLFKEMTPYLYITALTESEVKQYFTDNHEYFKYQPFDEGETIDDYWGDLIIYEAEQQ